MHHEILRMTVSTVLGVAARRTRADGGGCRRHGSPESRDRRGARRRVSEGAASGCAKSCGRCPGFVQVPDMDGAPDGRALAPLGPDAALHARSRHGPWPTPSASRWIRSGARPTRPSSSSGADDTGARQVEPGPGAARAPGLLLAGPRQARAGRAGPVSSSRASTSTPPGPEGAREGRRDATGPERASRAPTPRSGRRRSSPRRFSSPYFIQRCVGREADAAGLRQSLDDTYLREQAS